MFALGNFLHQHTFRSRLIEQSILNRLEFLHSVPTHMRVPFLKMSIFGPIGVHALPLAAGINEGGHYFR